MANGSKVNDCVDVLTNYLNWFNQSCHTSRFNDGCLISTPYTDIFGDSIELRITYSDDTARLSDDGDTYNNLYEFGIDLHRLSAPRQASLHRIISNTGVILDSSELLVNVRSSEDLGPAMHRLIEAIMAINGLKLTVKPTIIRDFNAEVKLLFEARQLPFQFDYRIQGASIEHRFDFHIAHQGKPDLIRTVSVDDKTRIRNHVSHAAFSFTDLKKTDYPFRGILLIDDSFPDVYTHEVHKIASVYADRTYKRSQLEALLADVAD